MKTLWTWLKRITAGVVVLIAVVVIGLWISFYFWRQESIEALPGKSTVIETSSGPVEYLLQGNSDKYILVAHGTPLSYRTFGLNPLLEAGYSIISPSRPGYFRTPISTGSTSEAQADAYAALLEALQIDSVAILAISGGGPSTLQFALRHPDKCTHMILLSTLVKKMPPQNPSFIEKVFSTEFGTYIAMQMALSNFDDDDTAMEAEKYVQYSMFPFYENREGLQNDRKVFTSLKEYPYEEIVDPTLIIHGTSDPLIPISHAEEIAATMPNATMMALEGKDHFQVVFFEFDKTLEMVMDYLDDN